MNVGVMNVGQSLSLMVPSGMEVALLNKAFSGWTGLDVLQH